MTFDPDKTLVFPVQSRIAAQDLDPGKFQKVSLPGETPWVKVIEITKEFLLGEIANDVKSSLHLYNLGDVVRFCWHCDRWMPDARVDDRTASGE